MSFYAKWILIVFITFQFKTVQCKTLPLESIKLPPGFKIEVYADNVPNARAMTLGSAGTVFVGSRTAGNVYAILDDPKNPNRKRVVTIAEDLSQPAGVAFKEGHLYVSSIDKIVRFDNIEKHLDLPPKPVTINNSFPDDQHHGWKFIAFGPDGLLYVPVGAPCNNCLSNDPRFASIMRMKPDGTNLEIFAHGVRNTVGFDWDPKTKELWFTDNGRDRMGEDIPPDELNHAPKIGMHFGYPFCHSRAISDDEYGKQRKCEEFTPSVVDLGPHVAALGMRFYQGNMFPREYQGKILIAEHGSWNRKQPLGYRISIVDPTLKTYKIFAEGWLQGDDAWGRPADVQMMPDGSILVSDDKANVIYRITYQK